MDCTAFDDGFRWDRLLWIDQVLAKDPKVLADIKRGLKALHLIAR